MGVNVRQVATIVLCWKACLEKFPSFFIAREVATGSAQLRQALVKAFLIMLTLTTHTNIILQPSELF